MTTGVKHRDARKARFVLNPTALVRIMSSKCSNASRTRQHQHEKTIKESSSKHSLRSAITIVHPHIYADESLKGPVIVETVTQALESGCSQPVMDSQCSIALTAIPDIVLWAGEVATRSRESTPGSLNDVRRVRPAPLCSESQNTPVASTTVITPVSATMTVETTPASAISDCFKAPPDIPQRSPGTTPTLHSYRPLSIQIPVKRSYSFRLSKTSFVCSRPSGSRRHATIGGGKSLLRRFVIAWKRVTSATHLKRRGKGIGRKTDGKRINMKLPVGFELVDPKQLSRLRMNSTSRRRGSELEPAGQSIRTE